MFQCFLGKLTPPTSGARPTPIVWTGVQGSLISAHTRPGRLQGSSLPRDSVGRAMNIIMKIGGGAGKDAVPRHKDSCETRTRCPSSNFELHDSAPHPIGSDSLMICRKARICTDASASPNSCACLKRCLSMRRAPCGGRRVVRIASSATIRTTATGM